GDVGTPDASRRPYHLHLELRRRGEALCGSAAVISLPTSRGGAMEYWVDLRRGWGVVRPRRGGAGGFPPAFWNTCAPTNPFRASLRTPCRTTTIYGEAGFLGSLGQGSPGMRGHPGQFVVTRSAKLGTLDPPRTARRRARSRGGRLPSPELGRVRHDGACRRK